MCGFQDVHRDLEEKLAEFCGAEKAIIFPSGYHCNIGVYQACFTPEDIIFSDQFNHASIIDGIRLTKSKRYVFKHRDYDMLEKMLKMAGSARFRAIITEGVFSMDADFADLKRLIELKKKYDCVLIVDDCHGLGVIGKNGGGIVEYSGVDINDVDIFISTIGKALGGATGGFVAGKKEIVSWMR
jgi:glycine C-acetyltransferase